MVVELVGGPAEWDGKIVEVPDGALTFAVDQLVPPALAIRYAPGDPTIMSGQYRRPSGQMDVMYWHGRPPR